MGDRWREGGEGVVVMVNKPCGALFICCPSLCTASLYMPEAGIHPPKVYSDERVKAKNSLAVARWCFSLKPAKFAVYVPASCFSVLLSFVSYYVYTF